MDSKKHPVPISWRHWLRLENCLKMLETRVNLNNLDLPTYINTEFIHILAHTFQHHEKSHFGNEEHEEDQLF